MILTITVNHLYKPLSWAKAGKGGTIPPGNQWVVKNAFQCESCLGVLFDNAIENVWVSGQTGFPVPTVCSSQSGDFAVVNDLTITNNTIKNVVSGFNTLRRTILVAVPHIPIAKTLAHSLIGTSPTTRLRSTTRRFLEEVRTSASYSHEGLIGQAEGRSRSCRTLCSNTILKGAEGLNKYNGDPSPLGRRFRGNIMVCDRQ